MKNISDLKLERYALGELPGKARDEIKNLIENDTALAARLESILKSNEEILSLYPACGMALKIQWKYNNEAAGEEKSRKIFPLHSLSFAGVLVSLFVFIFAMILLETSPFNLFRNNETDRAKGASLINIYRKTENSAELLSSGVIVKRGDVFQIKYSAADQKYGLIFSIDGNGYLTLHFPGSIQDSLLLDQGGEVALVESFKLDDAPGFERFFFVTSKKEFKIQEALDAGYRLAGDIKKAKAAKLVLPKNLNQESFILLKEGY